MAKAQCTVWLYGADGVSYRTLRRATPGRSGGVVSASWRITRTAGYADAELVLSGPSAATAGLALRRRVEFWGQDASGNPLRLYRGYIETIAPTFENGVRRTVVTLLGIWQLASQIVLRQRWAFAAPPDLSTAFSLAGNAWVAARYPSIRVEGTTVGQTVDALDGWRRTFGDVVQDLTEMTGGGAATGGDVTSWGQDRIFFRPYDDPAVTITHILPFPDPAKHVSQFEPETDASRIVNALDVHAGVLRFPNLLAQATQGNTSFEMPQVNTAEDGNLLSDAGFEDRDSGDVYGGASYKAGGLGEGPTDGGGTMVEADTVGEGVKKVFTSGLVAGHQYTAQARLRLIQGVFSKGCRIRLRMDWYNGSTRLGRDDVFFDDTSGLDAAVWDTFTLGSICPTGAARGEFSAELVNKVGDGVVIDNFAVFDAALVRQTGWKLEANGSSQILAVDWARTGSKHGAYCVYAKVQASDTDGQDVGLIPINGGSFPVVGNETLRIGAWFKPVPGGTTPKVMLYTSDDQGGNTRRTVTPGGSGPDDTPDAVVDGWYLYTATQTQSSGATSGKMYVIFRGTGEILIDACAVRDAAVPLPEWATTFVEADTLEFTGRADTVFSSGDLHDSIADWGERWEQQDQPSLTTQSDASKFLSAAFQAHALPVARPNIQVVGVARDFWPGQYVRGVGSDAARVLPQPLPIAEVEGSYTDGLLRLRPICVTEVQSETRLTRELARQEARKTGKRGSSYSGGGSGGSGGSGGGTGGTSLTIQDEGASVPQRDIVNFVGAGVTVTDDSLGARTTVTIPGGTGGGSGDMSRSTYDPDNDGVIALAQGGTGGTDASTARNNLGLGSAAQASTGTGSGNVPVLDGSGKLPTGILPALAISSTYTVASQSAMLALAAQEGDVAVRTDLSKSFILTGSGPATALSSWQELLTPTDAVQSVNGHTGTVTGLLEASNNLSDLGSASAARGNLGLGSAATHPAADFENALGNPTATGRVLASSTTGVRSWVDLPTVITPDYRQNVRAVGGAYTVASDDEVLLISTSSGGA